MAGQELALECTGPMGGGPGEGTGPGEKGLLSREFSLECTLGDLLPTDGGWKNDFGRFLILIGGCCNDLLEFPWTTLNRASISEAESSLTCRTTFPF